MGFFSGDKVIVGFDLGNEFSQISYSRPGTGEVETISQTAGAENYSIPTVLCKRSGVNQWFYGKEAVRKGEEEQGITVDNLLALAIDGEPVLIEVNLAYGGLFFHQIANGPVFGDLTKDIITEAL